MQDTFASATGVAAQITDLQRQPITRRSNYCRLCEHIIKKTPRGLEHCQCSDAALNTSRQNGLVVAPCMNGGMWHADAAITVDGQEIALWHIGQVLDVQMDRAALLRFAENIGADVEEFAQALNEIPRMSREQFGGVCRALQMVADHLSDLAARNIRQARDMEERQRLMNELQAKESLLQNIFESVPVGIILVKNRKIEKISRHISVITGYEAEDVEGRDVSMLFRQPEQSLDLWRASSTLGEETGALPALEACWRCKYGGYIDVLIGVNMVDPERPDQGYTLAITDISDRKASEERRLSMERRILQTQKLESLGVLAGGIAHDFNNLLTAVLGNISLAKAHLPDGSLAYQDLHMAEAATRQSADLAKQMLDYSGKGRFEVRPVDLRQVIEELTHMLQVAISKKIEMRIDVSARVPAIMADVSQIRQVIMNLVINASEAIGATEGVIDVSVGQVFCDAEFFNQLMLKPQLPSGLYAYIQVADSGCGIKPENLAKIFDPFFTTKFTGRGLGLAAVIGIVHGHKGAIGVVSEPGQGTTFKVYFPAIEHADVGRRGDVSESRHWIGQGLLLLVDDEESICLTGRKMLEHLGFEVLVARDGLEAVGEYRRRGGDIKAVILDLTMPRMDGVQAFHELQQVNPDVVAILSSGYNVRDIAQQFQAQTWAGFIQKPYTLDSLRDVLMKVVK